MKLRAALQDGSPSSLVSKPGSASGAPRLLPFDAIPELCQDSLLHELFEHRADAQPGQIALACGAERMNYGELEDKANQVAHILRAQGVGRGSVVGLLLPRSMDVYVGLLAILKAGAAYVPLDPDYPADRIQFILGDCQAGAVITVAALAVKLGSLADRAVLLDTQTAGLFTAPKTRLSRLVTGTQADDLCYIIYTSGSTGRPKGVAVEHRSVCHLVRAEGRIFQVSPQDRVFQGFSIAFDASVEEVWLAFFAGATLVVGTREMVFSGPSLSRHLTEAGVTVYSTVPTQLAMMVDDVPSLRLLILGGEACQADLVNRWTKPGRRMVNTYGPTEATVIATWGELRLGEAVTIGRPIPNCHICLLDEHQTPVKEGEVGELCIGGIPLARGYVGRPDLTQEKFIATPGILPGQEPARLYRTGDLARVTAAGDLEFMGRIDSQVKLRGYRVELAEIESVLLASPGVRAAAVAVREDVPGVQQLVGYIIASAEPPPAEADLRRTLRERLPPYMVPAVIDILADLPRLPSGKVDRRSLPPPRARVIEEQADYVAPRTPMEKRLAAAWERLFAPQKVSLKADFFTDLGGHSLLAARLVSDLRQASDLRGMSILDVYQHPNIEALARQMEGSGSKKPEAGSRKQTDQGTTAFKRRHFLCGCAQLIALFFILGIFSIQWLAPYYTYSWVYLEGYSRWEAILAAFGILVAFYPFLILLTIALKWGVIGRYRPGRYPLWGFYHFRFWFINAIQSAVPVGYLSGTPLLNLYYRLLGARIGRDVHLATPCLVCADLVAIGDRTCVGVEASLTGFHIEDGQLVVGSIRIGHDCFVGARAVVRENTVMADKSALEDLSLLGVGKSIPTGERWRGSPARPDLRAKTGEPASATPMNNRQGFLHILLYALGITLFPACVLSAIIPGVIFLSFLSAQGCGLWILTAAPLVGLSYVVLLCLEMAAIKWLLLGRVRPGTHSLNSFFRVRKWFVDELLELSLDVLGPLYASIYLAPWYRLLGAKLGYHAEVSTASFISPDLLEVGAESFIADSVSLGSGRVEKGQVTLGVNRIGTRAFVGNSALLPPGTILGDDALIGCLSLPPDNPEDAAFPGATWLGSPAIRLPQRQPSTAFAVESTFRPTPKLRAQRAAIEFIRVIMPVTGFVMLTIVLFEAMDHLETNYSFGWMLLWLPLLYACCGGIAMAVVIAAKWLLAGRYQPGEKPLWCTFVWRNELVNALQEHLASEYIVNLLAGTPFVCWYFRCLGARIGRRVYLDTTDITEYDLVSIGDEAEINADATLQTHLFEDRVMKLSHVKIGARANVGSASLVLYDTHMEPGAKLNDLSLLMKGETLPANTAWEGIPARPTSD